VLLVDLTEAQIARAFQSQDHTTNRIVSRSEGTGLLASDTAILANFLQELNTVTSTSSRDSMTEPTRISQSQHEVGQTVKLPNSFADFLWASLDQYPPAGLAGAQLLELVADIIPRPFDFELD
jgi:hypothetical protein